MAKSLRDQQLIELKDTIKTLNTTVKELKALLKDANKREEEHVKREQVMQEQIDYLTKKLFGRSREKRDEQIEGQMSLFNEPEAVKTKPDPAEEEFVTVEKHKRKKKVTITRAGQTAKEYMEGFAGYLMTDGYGGYNKLKDCICTSCWSHVRRYLIGAIPKGKEYDHTQPAVQGLVYVDKLFEMERKIHAKNGVTFDDIKAYRLEKEVPVLDGFFAWLDAQTSIKGSRFEKALIYIRNRREFLTTYLEDGGCSFNNNTSERSCKAFVTGRKNWLFADTLMGPMPVPLYTR